MERFKHAENLKDLSVNMTLSTTLRPTIIINDIIYYYYYYYLSHILLSYGSSNLLFSIGYISKGMLTTHLPCRDF